jgi:hypothetical protein
MACVSLAERCADILFAVREEIELAGGKVTETLKDPVQKLTESVIRPLSHTFSHIHRIGLSNSSAKR